MKYQAIVFDLDGVLIDSKECMRRCWLSVKQKINSDITFETYFQHIGKPFKNILFEIGVPESKWSEAETVYFETQVTFSNIIKPFEGVDYMLNELSKSYVLGVVTSKSSKTTGIILKQFGWKFSSVVTPENCGRGKPYPDPLLYFSAFEQIEPSRCVYIGDMTVDRDAAEGAGFDFVRAEWGYQDFAAKSVKSPRKLLEYLKA
jgi:phosphoglycolate phosphatase